jgi:hypothetical protein
VPEVRRLKTEDCEQRAEVGRPLRKDRLLKRFEVREKPDCCRFPAVCHNPHRRPLPVIKNTDNATRLLGDHSEREPPDPIPNSEVKPLSADDSVAVCHAKVGNCQALISKPKSERLGFFCLLNWTSIIAVAVPLTRLNVWRQLS